MKTYFFSLILWMLATNAYGQEWVDDPLPSLDTLIAEAIAYTPLIKELKLKKTQEQEFLKVEKKSWLSSFRVGLQFLDVQQGYAAEPTTIGVLPSLGGSVQLDLHQLFTTKSRVRTRKADIERVKENIATKEDDIALWMSSAYLNFQQALEQSRLLKQLLDTQEEQLALVRVRFEKGEGKIEDYMMVQNSVIQTKSALLKAMIGAQKAYQEIQIMTGKKY